MLFSEEQCCLPRSGADNGDMLPDVHCDAVCWGVMLLAVKRCRFPRSGAVYYCTRKVCTQQ